MIYIGKIVGFHGLKGEMKISSNSDFTDLRFKKGAKIKIDSEEFEIEQVRFHKTWILKFVGVDSLTLAEKYKNKDIFSEERVDDTLEEDEYLYSDLIGCTVTWDDEIIGSVFSLREVGNNANLVLKRPNGSKMEIPFVSDFITQVNINDKKITVKLIDGFIE